jgi:phage baseplate assembly protein W
MQVKYPFQVDTRGRTSAASDDEHVRELIEQLLFTAPGERVNRPTFGTGLRQLVFAPNSPALVEALQLSVQSSLQQWLGDLIEVDSLEVAAEDAVLRVQVVFRNRRDGQQHVARFERGA